MNKAFEKILERLSNIRRVVKTDEDAEWNRAIYKSTEIVQEVAEENKKNDYVNEIQEMALELAAYVLEEEFLKYAWLENANNETGVVVTYKDAICIIKDMLKGSETDEEDI